MTVRTATQADLPRIVDTLTEAFRDDPWMRWITRDDGRRTEARRTLFRSFARRIYLPQGHCYLTEDGCSAALWMPPGGRSGVGVVASARVLPTYLRTAGLGRIVAMARAGSFLERRHPRERHYYLFAIGTRPEAQGRGLGSQLLEHVLARCDREGAPAYLENTLGRNVAFYRRHGFEVVEEVRAPGGGPPAWLMWRDAAR